MATTGKKKVGKKNGRTGDPITVGGGGGRRKRGGRGTPVQITFKGASYEDQDPQGKKKKKYFKHKTAVMKSLAVFINDAPTSLTHLVPASSSVTCKVMITCNSTDEDLEIHSNRIRIRLHTGKYPPESGDAHEGANTANFIHRVKVTRSDKNGSYDSGELKDSDKVVVVADTL